MQGGNTQSYKYKIIVTQLLFHPRKKSMTQNMLEVSKSVFSASRVHDAERSDVRFSHAA